MILIPLLITMLLNDTHGFTNMLFAFYFLRKIIIQANLFLVGLIL